MSGVRRRSPAMTSVPGPIVGFIGLGDQGLPIATAIADAGFELHVWARHAASLNALGDAPHVAHATARELASACDVVALCVSTDEDVLGIVEDELLDSLRKRAIVVNHGTGTPANAIRLTELCAGHGVEVLDAPVAGGHQASHARALTTFVGGQAATLERCRPVFESFASHVLHMGAAGSGQMTKLFNNALLGMNQANIEDIIELAVRIGTDPVRLVGALKLGSATSAALTLLNTMITPETVDHLSEVEALDMQLFDQALKDAGVDGAGPVARARAGNTRLPEIVARLAGEPAAP